ncbi:MAG: heme exporter protein CcmD [Methylocystaceae bacterium]|jgi:heme exporter protein CcmD|nr:heme exporter protein CcmD [Methylocystaceae bacterium]
MSEHMGFVVLAYTITIVTISVMAARIILDYRRLCFELEKRTFNASSNAEDKRRD